MKLTIKTLAAAAIAASTIAGASAVTTTAASAAALNVGGLKTEIAQKGANNGAVQQARYWGYRRCFRIPVYRWRWTPYGWRRVFVGFRIRCRRPYWGHRPYRPGFRIHLSF